MGELLLILAQILQPLSVGLVATAIISGLLLGGFYNYSFDLPDSMVVHTLAAGLGFLVSIFSYRLMTSIVGGAAVPTIFGWIGIALLWSIFCLSIWGGESIIKKVFRRFR